LKTAEGVPKRTLPRLSASDGRRQPRDSRELLRESLGDRWKAFRKRVHRGLPRRAGRPQTDDAVHDLRTSARRLLSVLESIKAVRDGKAVRRLSKRVKRILDRLSVPRDLSVERTTLARVGGNAGSLRGIERKLDLDYHASVERSRRLLDRVELDELRDEKKGIARRLRRSRGGERSLERDLLGAARAARDRVLERRAAVDPNRVQTLHQLRVALKKFRYLMEVVSPLVPGTTEAGLEALHALQTTLGDLHDLEVLSGAISGYLSGGSPVPPRTLSPVLLNLEREHHRMLRSLLQTVDPILDAWTELLGERPDSGR
jgi:CHAD domain-containing protein